MKHSTIHPGWCCAARTYFSERIVFIWEKVCIPEPNERRFCSFVLLAAILRQYILLFGGMLLLSKGFD